MGIVNGSLGYIWQIQTKRPSSCTHDFMGERSKVMARLPNSFRYLKDLGRYHLEWLSFFGNWAGNSKWNRSTIQINCRLLQTFRVYFFNIKLASISWILVEHVHDSLGLVAKVLHGVLVWWWKWRVAAAGSMISITCWWFGTFVIFHNIWDNPSHWLIFFQHG